MLARLPEDSLAGHAQRSDFSRWISEVFGDYPLSAEVRKVERQYRRGEVTDLADSLIAPIRGRSKLVVVGLPAKVHQRRHRQRPQQESRDTTKGNGYVGGLHATTVSQVHGHFPEVGEESVHQEKHQMKRYLKVRQIRRTSGRGESETYQENSS